MQPVSTTKMAPITPAICMGIILVAMETSTPIKITATRSIFPGFFSLTLFTAALSTSFSGRSFTPKKHIYRIPMIRSGKPIFVYSKNPNSRRPLSFKIPFATIWGVVPTRVTVPPRDAKYARAIRSLDFLTFALSAMEPTIGIRQAVEPVSFKKEERPPATMPVPRIKPFSVFPRSPIIFPPRNSARPVLKKASPTTTSPIKNTTVVFPKSE